MSWIILTVTFQRIINLGMIKMVVGIWVFNVNWNAGGVNLTQAIALSTIFVGTYFA